MNDDTIPFVWYSEDTEAWYAKGHVPAPLMLLGVLVEQITLAGDDEAAELLVGRRGDITQENAVARANDRLKVSHLWMAPSPDDAEWLIPAIDDEAAKPYTELRP